MKLPIAAFVAILPFGAPASAQPDAPPRLIPLGCNYDGALSWLAAGRATVGPEPNSFRVEIPGLDLDRAEAQISPSRMHAFAPYAGPRMVPLSVAGTTIASRHVNGVPDGNIVTVRFGIAASRTDPVDLSEPGAIAYVLVLSGKITGCRRGT
jgi:hypothetical protein